MTNKLFVARLPFRFTNDQLRDLFAGLGTVVSAEMVSDPKSGLTRGFGFVTMATAEEAAAAMEALKGKQLGDKEIFVTEAREKQAGGAPPKRRLPLDFPDRRAGAFPRRPKPFGRQDGDRPFEPRPRGPRRFSGPRPDSFSQGGIPERRPHRFGPKPAGSFGAPRFNAGEGNQRPYRDEGPRRRGGSFRDEGARRRSEFFRSDAPRQDGPRREGYRPSGPGSAGPRSGGPRFSGPRPAGPRSAGPRSEGQRFGGPRSSGPRFGGPRPGGDRPGGPRRSGPPRGPRSSRGSPRPSRGSF